MKVLPIGKPGTLLLSLIFSLLAGCSGGSPEPQTQVSGPVSRIVSLAPNLTELAYEAGAGEKLVAVVEYSDYPPEALELPRIGDAFRIDFERIRELNPDLVLVWESGNPKEMQSKLREMGFPLLVLEPDSLEDVAEHIRLIGARAGTERVAAAAADAYLAKLQDVFKRYGSKPSRRVFYQISADPWYTVSGKHVISDIISRCGGINVFADLPALAPAVSPESVVAANPEIIIASASPDSAEDWTQVWRRFSGVDAVKAGRFVSVDSSAIGRSSPRLAIGAEELCRGMAAFDAK